ncbi:hypothetical protein HK405_015262 [Cladochytrium tenue]|nr:hypothetical protein HK405_015262 [Cladochytrium tenue]
MEATHLAERAPSHSGSGAGGSAGFDKRFMGMMMDLMHRSWDVKAFLKGDGESVVRFLDVEATWGEKVVPLLEDSSFVDLVERLTRLVYPNFRRGMLPVGLNPYFQPHVTATSWQSYTLPNAPLITAVLVRRLLDAALPAGRPWAVAWTHGCNSAAEAVGAAPSRCSPTVAALAGSVLLPHLAKHRTYAAVVSRAGGDGGEGRGGPAALDFLDAWAADVGREPQTAGGAADGGADRRPWLVRVALGDDERDGDKDGGGEDDSDAGTGSGRRRQRVRWVAPRFYTCDDEARLVEYVEEYYHRLHGDGGGDGDDAAATDGGKVAPAFSAGGGPSASAEEEDAGASSSSSSSSASSDSFESVGDSAADDDAAPDAGLGGSRARAAAAAAAVGTVASRRAATAQAGAGDALGQLGFVAAAAAGLRAHAAWREAALGLAVFFAGVGVLVASGLMEASNAAAEDGVVAVAWMTFEWV